MTPNTHNKIDYAIGVLAAFCLGVLVCGMHDNLVEKDLVKYESQVDCDAAFVNLSAEQIMTIETCNTDTECYALATALGVPKECAE
jgi:hypothetical protein